MKTIDEILNSVISSNKKTKDGVSRSFWSVMFVSDDLDKVNRVIKSYLENDLGANVITVTPSGYEIPKDKAGVDVDGRRVFPIIYPDNEMTDKLKQENTVLFLPNLDEMKDKSYRRLLLDMAREHIVADYRNEEIECTKLKDSFIAVATVGRMDKKAMFELTTMDAKDSFRVIDFDKDVILQN